MSKISQYDYWDEIANIANEINEESKRADTDGFGDDFDAYDRAHEWIDGHQWIIYTAYHMEVLQYTDNRDYYMDECGFEVGPGTSLGDVLMRSAFYTPCYKTCLVIPGFPAIDPRPFLSC